MKHTHTHTHTERERERERESEREREKVNAVVSLSLIRLQHGAHNDPWRIIIPFANRNTDDASLLVWQA